ncbi:MAG: oligosaccharide flippase family protein [Ignisphaera sp.]
MHILTDDGNSGEYLIESLRLAAGNTFILFLGEFLYNLILAIGSFFIARILGSEGYGAFSLALVPPLSLVSLMSLGIDTAATRYIQKFLAEKRRGYAVRVIKASLLLRLSINLVGFALCFLLSTQMAQMFTNRAELGPYVKVTSIVALFQGLYSLFLAIFIGMNMAVGASITKVVYSISKIVISISLLAIFGMGVMGALLGNIAGYAISLVAATAFLVILLRRSGNDEAGDVRGITVELLRYGIPLYISSTVSIAVSIYQNLLLAYTLPLTDIGGYRAISNFSVLISVVSAPISASLLPLFTQFYARSQKLDELLDLLNRYTAFVLVPVTMAAMIFSRELIYLFYGSQYLFAYRYLPLLLAPNLLSGLGGVTVPALLNAVGDTKANMKASIISSIVLVATSYILTIVLDLGLWGYLTSLLISSIVGTIAAIQYAKRYVMRVVNVRESIGIYAASAVALVAVVPIFYIPIPRLVSLFRLAVGFTLFVLVYIALSIYARIIGEADIKFFVNAFSKFPLVNVVMDILARYAIALTKLVNSSRRGRKNLQ